MAEEIEIIVTATGFDKVSSGLKNTTDALKTTATEAKKTGDAMRTNLNNGANQAGQSILNLSRIAQDAPYGFIGIANNINPLVESFGRLKAETGSTGGALKALVSGLSGPAGLGLAFGVVTAAITFAQMGFQAWTRGSKEAKENSDLFKKDLEALKRELSAVTDELNNFINVADNASKLNDINIVARFSDKTEQATLQRQSKFITISEELVKATEARQKAWENLAAVTRNQFKTEDEYNQAYKAALDIYNQTIKKENELSAARELQAATNRAATVEEKRAAAERAKNNKKSKKSIETLKDAYNAFINTLVNNEKIAFLFNEPATKQNIQAYESFIETAVKKFKATPTFTIPLVVELNKLKKSLDKVKPKDLISALQDQINLTPIEIPFDIPKGSIDNIKNKAIILVSDLQKALIDSFNIIGKGIGEGIANAIAGTANFGDIFQGIFKQLGGVVQALGEQILAIGIAAVVASDSLKAIFTNPYAAIAAGIALVALGSLIQNTTTPRNRFAVGTRNAPGGMALVGERGPELINLPKGSQVIPSAQTSNMLGGMPAAVEIYGILRGQDIYFSNKKYSATYARTT
jgi:hypothetical protein